MQTTYTLPVRKTGESFSVDMTKVSPELVDRIFLYGLTQITNDCHASVSKDEPGAVMAAIQKRWDAIYSGEWRVRTAAGEPTDPVAKMAFGFAREAVKAAVAKAGKKWKDYTDEQRDAAVTKMFERDEAKFTAQAKEAIAAKKQAASGADLADLGL